MKNVIRTLGVALPLAMVYSLSTLVPASANSVLAPEAKVEKLADSFSFTEGPASDAAGNVFFTDQPNNRIHKWSVDGKLSTFLEPSGRANGLSFDKEGNLWACADETNQLWRIDAKGKTEVVLTNFGGKLRLEGKEYAVQDGDVMHFRFNT